MFIIFIDNNKHKCKVDTNELQTESRITVTALETFHFEFE